MEAWQVAATLALAGFVLFRNLPGALLCLFPRLLRARSEDESWPKVDRDLLERMEDELAPLGFSRLGVHVERAPLQRGVVAYDFVHEEAGTWATGYGPSDEARLLLVTALDRPGSPDGFVVTADHRLLAVDAPGCLCGGMPGAQPENLFAAHRRRVQGLQDSGWKPSADLSLEARVRAADAWFAGRGARELLLRHVNRLLMALLGLAVLGTLLGALIRRLG